ncbi:pleckstrin y domain containing, D (with coiled-coil domains) member 1 [Chamberlinius hualienensis]
MSEYGEDSFNITTKLHTAVCIAEETFWSSIAQVVKKGVIPLGGCTIDPVCDNNQEYAIHIKSNEFNNLLQLIIITREREMASNASGSETWKNTQLGESLIRQLEHQGLQLCREKTGLFWELEEEKNTILKEMSATEAENSKLSESQDSLKNMLKTIEEDTKLLLEEKEEVENRCKTNEIHAQILSEEKKLISDHALTLESSMQDLLTQKVLTETELKEEILARIDAEKRLKNAEEALHHLEDVIKTGGHSNMNIVREEIMPDVRRLKKFFEDVAEEAKIDAHKPIIMKNAVLARKRYMQLARTQTLYNQRSEKVKSLGITLDCPEPCGRGLHRSLSTIVTNREHKLGNRPTSSLLRSLSTRNAKTSRQLKDGYNFPTTNSETHVNSINIDGNEVTLRRQLSVVKE